MARNSSPRLAKLSALLLAVTVVVRAGAAPVDSDMASSTLGGGCHPTGVQPSILDMLTLINPEWAPVLNGPMVDSKPVLIHGVVQEMHGDLSGDFPSTHLRADVNEFLLLDAVDADRLATGNDDGLVHFEWEAGVFPAFAWAGVGDRVTVLGRWIFDCGHPGATPGDCSGTLGRQCVLDGDCRPPICATCGALETCVGPHYAYSSELHPPYANATIRSGRGGIVSSLPGAKPVPVTRADVYVSPNGGGAGDRCVLTHLDPDAMQLSVECFPLAQPIAPINSRDFVFDLPLPAKPSKGRLGTKITQLPAPGGVAARVQIKRKLAGPSPHLQVRVRLAKKVGGALPTGFAGTIEAGWRNDTTPLTHVRVTLDSVHVNNALQPGTPSVPRTCSVSDTTPCTTAADCPSGEQCFGVGPIKTWNLQVAVNGQWQELTGLDTVDTGDTIPQGLVFDQDLPAGGSVHILANGAAHDCIDSMYGKSLAAGLVELGLGKGLVCLASSARRPGDVDVTYAGPDFGAGSGGSMIHAITSTGGAGGSCSVTTGMLCVVDADCPSGESCNQTGGALTLDYHVERLP